MPRSVQKVGNLIETEFTVYDSLNAPVTGLTNSDFTKLLSINGTDSAIPVTVSEIGNGRYEAFFTPPVVGDWYLVIRNTTYNQRGWDESFDVTIDGQFSVEEIIEGDIGSYSIYEALHILLGIAVGNIQKTGNAFNFMAVNSTSTIVSATVDANGNRNVTGIYPP